MRFAPTSCQQFAEKGSEAQARLSGIADAFLAGERPIARRVEDLVARCGPFGTAILRRSRDYAPGAVSQFPFTSPILALGADLDLKSTIAIVVDGQVLVSQHIGDMDDYESQQAFRQTLADLTASFWGSYDAEHWAARVPSINRQPEIAGYFEESHNLFPPGSKL